VKGKTEWNSYGTTVSFYFYLIRDVVQNTLEGSISASGLRPMHRAYVVAAMNATDR